MPLVPDTPVDNVKLAVSAVCQPPTPPEATQSDQDSVLYRHALLVLWYACWIAVAFVLHILVGHSWSYSRNGGGTASQSCPYRIPRAQGRTVLSSRSMMEGDSSSFPFANVDDDVLAGLWESSSRRGRRCAAVGNNDVPSGSNLLAGQAAEVHGPWIDTNVLAANPRGSSACQTLSSSVPSTSLLRSPHSLSTPYSTVQSPSSWERHTHLSGPVHSQSHRSTGPEGPTSIFEPRLGLARILPLTATLLSSSWRIFEPRPTDPSTRIAPLFATLYPGLGDLLLASKIKWFILVVAVTCKEFGVMDPKFDFAFLRKVFGRSVPSRVRFRGLTEEDATLKNIQAELVSLYNEAQEASGPFRLCVYLTGMGNGDSKMTLFGNNVISEQDLGSWMSNLRAQSTGTQDSNPASAIFDICREAMERQGLVNRNLGLVWSSGISPLPSAYAIPLGKGYPSSCFLITIFSASYDLLVGSNTFEEAIRLRLEQLGDYLLFLYHKRHATDGRCNSCEAHEKCLPPVPQVPEWDSVGLDMLSALGELIRTEYSEYARKVSEALQRKMEKQGFQVRKNDSHLPSSSNQDLSVPEARFTARHFRGANERTSQTVRHTS